MPFTTVQHHFKIYWWFCSKVPLRQFNYKIARCSFTDIYWTEDEWNKVYIQISTKEKVKLSQTTPITEEQSTKYLAKSITDNNNCHYLQVDFFALIQFKKHASVFINELNLWCKRNNAEFLLVIAEVPPNLLVLNSLLH